MFPLSNILENTYGGYTIKKDTITHLLYMDDLKLYANNDKALHNMVTATHIYSNDIGMNFGIEKCAKVTLKKGKQVASENIKLEENFAVQDLAQEKNYKYLGVEEGGGISHSKMKGKIRNEFCKRVRKVLKTELNSKNKLMAINCLAVPVVTYGFNLIDWNFNIQSFNFIHVPVD